MARVPRQYSEQFRALDQLREIHEQEGELRNYDSSRIGSSDLLGLCSATRMALEAGERDVNVDADRLRDLLAAFQDLLLMNVPAEDREELRSAAAHSATFLVEGLAFRICAVEQIVLAELNLRLLIVLTLEFVSRTDERETRLPEWSCRIEEAERDMKVACESWLKIANSACR